MRLGRRDQYIIDPPYKDECDPNTGVRRYRRYSCAGFVIDGYRQVNIELLQLDASSLPEVDRQTIESAYAGVSRELLDQFGLHGDGPWRIILAGYVLHALDRSTDDIHKQPYKAQSGDESF